MHKKINENNSINKEEFGDIKKWQESQDPIILEKMIQKYNKLILKISNNFKFSNIDRNDLIIEGSLAIMAAMNNFNFEKKINFMSYAYYYIKNYILNFINRVKKQFTRYDIKISSLDSKLNGSDLMASDILESNIINQNDQILWEEMTLALEKAYVLLTNKERYIIKSIFFENIKIEAISEELNFSSKEKVRYIKKNAINKLKQYLKNSGLFNKFKAFFNIFLILNCF